MHPLINTLIPPPSSLCTHTCTSVNLGKSCGLKFQKILDDLKQPILWKLQGIHPFLKQKGEWKVPCPSLGSGRC